MGYDILSNTTHNSWNCGHAWGCYLDLAEAFGWAPEQNGSHYYIGNDYQNVSDKDARAIANALLLAIAYIQDVQPINMTANGTTLLTFDVEDVPHLCDLVALTLAGGFTVA